ncbi:uncharacterized protein P884DRAFT_260310 [Thermothelomyces heterothallicus CBS 202.75]|uniref:uncharacterized protein n=1 Tax=Thermothelomyces heterothallicus CBS 202.75 TaxID=1149848 RepID=UPI003744977A
MNAPGILKMPCFVAHNPLCFPRNSSEEASCSKSPREKRNQSSSFSVPIPSLPASSGGQVPPLPSARNTGM